MFILFLSGCVLAWLWLHNSNKESGTPAPLRSMLNKNEALFSSTLSDGRLSKDPEKVNMPPKSEGQRIDRPSA